MITEERPEGGNLHENSTMVNYCNANWVSANKESIKLYNMLQQVTLKGLRIPDSGFRIPDSRFQIATFHKPYKNMADSK